jgi:hypothetical protein
MTVNYINRLQSYLNLNKKIIFTILVVRLTFPFTLVVDLGDFAFLVLSSGFVASLIVIRFSALDPSSVGLEIDSCSPVEAVPQDPARAPDSSHTLCVPARLACLGSLSFFLCGSSLTTPSINFCAACFFFLTEDFPRVHVFSISCCHLSFSDTRFGFRRQSSSCAKGILFCS